ncbi:protein containing DUF367, partial [mine drainage metagenome]
PWLWMGTGRRPPDSFVEGSPCCSPPIPSTFGRLAELNTVEAFAAALYLVGAPGRAAEILAGFRGGTTFLELNRERLTAYRAAATSDEVRAVERRLFGGPVTR